MTLGEDGALAVTGEARHRAPMPTRGYAAATVPWSSQ